MLSVICKDVSTNAKYSLNLENLKWFHNVFVIEMNVYKCGTKYPTGRIFISRMERKEENKKVTKEARIQANTNRRACGPRVARRPARGQTHPSSPLSLHLNISLACFLWNACISQLRDTNIIRVLTHRTNIQIDFLDSVFVNEIKTDGMVVSRCDALSSYWWQ